MGWHNAAAMTDPNRMPSQQPGRFPNDATQPYQSPVTGPGAGQAPIPGQTPPYGSQGSPPSQGGWQASPTPPTGTTPTGAGWQDQGPRRGTAYGVAAGRRPTGQPGSGGTNGGSRTPPAVL